MDPVMRVVLAIVGAFAGATIGAEGSHVFDALIGACGGFAVADLSYIRLRLRALEENFSRLERRLAKGARDAAFEPVAEELPRREAAAPAPGPSRSATLSPSATHRQSALPSARAVASEATATLAAHRPAPAQGSAQEPPNLIIDDIRGFFSGGNLLVRLGVIVLFFGIAFLLRYVAEHTRVPIEYRLSGVALGAVGLLVLGWRLRTSRPGFALSIQGGAIGILYLTVFAAFHLYVLMPPAAAFALLALIAVLSALLAISQNSQSLAFLGVTGGFLAPILASNGNGDHLVLFGYYAVLNAGIVLVAWFKSWRGLNLAGFGFTFGIGTVWGVLTYRAADFATTEPFLILFFLLYLGIAVLFTWRQPPRLRGYIDGTLVFGTPLAAFGLQASMLHDRHFALAYSALAMSAMYLGIATLLRRRRDDTQRLLIEAFLAVGMVLLTIAVPLALGSRWNAGAWALEGAALIWIGCRQNRLLSRLFGALLLIAAGFLLAREFAFLGSFPILPWNTYVVVMLVGVTSAGSAATLFSFARMSRRAEVILANLLFCWGVFWWSLGGIAELSHFVPAEYLASAALTFLSLTAVGVSVLHGKLKVPAAVAVALTLFPIMLMFALGAATSQNHPFAHGGWIAWPVAFVCFYAVLYRQEAAVGSPGAEALHVASAWLLIALSSWEMQWLVNYLVHGSNSWPAVAWAIIPAAALATLALGSHRVSWPLARHRDPYVIVAIGLALALTIWSIVMELSMTGDVAPLSYVPLLNPVDVVQVFVLLALWRYWRAIRTLPSVIEARVDPRVPAFALGALTFLWLNASLLRTLHQQIQVPWNLSGMLASTVTQTTLSIFWASLALAAMVLATRKSERSVWFAGAALLATVIAKLFFVDLSSVGSIARIVSFVGVGLLMLVIGYFSPLPPRSSQKSMRGRSSWLSWALAACTQTAILAHATDMGPQTFAYGYPIVLPVEAPAYRFNLPLAIFQGTVRADLGDLAVFNARDEIVPFFIRPLPAKAQPVHSPESLPLFPLLGKVPTAAEMRVSVDSPNMTLTLNSPGIASGTVPSLYILDGRAAEESITALQLVWAQAPVEFSGSLRIESSDDLQLWRIVVAAASVASLQADGRQFLHTRIELPPTRAKYLRLSWIGETPSVALTKVLAEFTNGHADPGWESETVEARQDSRRSSDYVFDLGGHVPVERVDLQLLEANSVVVADLYSRKDPRDAWSFVTRGRFYRIHAPAGDTRNAPINIPTNQDRYWLARVPSPAPTGALALVAAWRPRELVFLAHGTPPFLLAYGSSSSTVAGTDLTSMISDIALPAATLVGAEKLGGTARLVAAKPSLPGRRWVLWGVLLGALAALTYMAARLIKDTGRPEPPT